MNQEKIKLLLDKIVGMYRTIKSSGDPMEPIERDLMLGYIRQLYEEFNPTQPSSSRDPFPERSSRTPPPAPEPSIPAYTPPVAPPEADPPSRPPADMPGTPMGKLFEQPKTNELGDKLSNSPISDLRKAFTINDRLLFTNELFGGDRSTFEQALHFLNQYDQFSEAQHYLEQMADQYHWLSEEREPIARDFVRTVRRRFPR
jgi:hypothetical protein